MLMGKRYKVVLIRKYFHPDSLILGETAEQVATAAESIINKGDIEAVILDQNLVYGDRNYYGTDISKKLVSIVKK